MGSTAARDKDGLTHQTWLRCICFPTPDTGMNHGPTPTPNDRDKKACLRQVPGNKPVPWAGDRGLQTNVFQTSKTTAMTLLPHTLDFPYIHIPERSHPPPSWLVAPVCRVPWTETWGVSSCHNVQRTPSPILPVTSLPRMGRHTCSRHQERDRAEQRASLSPVHQERITGHPG